MPVQPNDYNLKVLLGIPFAGRYVPPEWSIALATIAWPMNCRYAFAPCKGMPREQAREELVARALQHKAEYLAMLDDDVQPPADWIQLLVRELDTHPDYDIISAVVPSQQHEPMIFERPFGGAFWRWKKGDVFEIAECATACILIRTSVFTTLPKPWFRDLNTMEECVAAGMYAPGQFDRGSMTDDIYFCTKARAAGHRLLAHGGVLPIHWNRKGAFSELPPDSYPFQPSLPLGDANGLRIEEALAIPGWMSAAELLWLAEHASAAKEIVEIGSYCGRSTRALAENTSGRVTAVDPWVPTAETRGAGDTRWRSGSEPPGDWLWDDFRMNMLGLTNVHAMRLASVDAARQVPDDVKFDMVFIDGNHAYEDARADIEAWRTKLAPGGLLCGHDWDDGWPGVQRAVAELVPNAEHGPGSIWYAPVA